MSDDPTPTPDPTPTETTYTQADLDRLVGKARVEERRKASEKYADYDDLKARAEQASEFEGRATTAEDRAHRAEVALAKGLTPAQAKRLVGTTREEFEADADELLADLGTQRQNGNQSPREGNTPQTSDDPMRTFARGLFEQAKNS